MEGLLSTGPTPSSFHIAMLEAIQEGLVRLEFTPTTLKEVTTKNIYKGRLEEVLPLPKVELEYPGIDFPALV